MNTATHENYGWIGIDIDVNKEENASFLKEYVSLVISASVKTIKDADSKVSVILGLRRLSDGLETKFTDVVSADQLRKFIDTAKENETINYLVGKPINTYYAGQGIVRIEINKYAFL